MSFDWPTWTTAQALGDGRTWTAAFDSYDQYRENCYYRVQLFDGDRLLGEFVTTISTGGAGDDWVKSELAKEIRSRISRAAYETFFVDGAVYRWVREEDDRNQSISFSHRGVVYEDIVTITAGDDSKIRFLFPIDRLASRGWWRDNPTMSAAVAERAVRIAQRTGAGELVGAAVDEALYGPPRTLIDELAAATTAIALGDDNVREAFVQCWLAIGCTDARDRDSQLAIDDWIASHANALVAARDTLQLLLEKTGSELHVYSNRSALAFLLEACARVNVELVLDTAQVDEALDKRNACARPWGIPESHTWWRTGYAPRRYDPHDDDD